MTIKHVKKLNILVVGLAIIFGLTPTVSHAGFFDWLGNYGTDSMNYSNSLISQGSLLYSSSIFSQKDGDQGQFTSLFQSDAITQPSSILTVATAKDDIPTLTLVGQASYYSRAGCLGCNRLRIMANGQTLVDEALTIAIGANRSYLVGRSARVTNLASGQSALVRITDTGGFYQAKYGYRVADLSVGTKQAIGMTGGLAQVRVEVF